MIFLVIICTVAIVRVKVYSCVPSVDGIKPQLLEGQLSCKGNLSL